MSRAALKAAEAAIDIGSKWMLWWLDQEECACEYGHTCGRDERITELGQMEAALAKVRAELAEPEWECICQDHLHGYAPAQSTPAREDGGPIDPDGARGPWAERKEDG